MPQDKYIDNSGDRKYFAMIPHYITNHSTAYEQSLYLQMKRLASESGTCWASPTFLGKRMGASANTVRKYREKLIERGWIKKVGERKVGKTNQTINEYEIVDLWKLNIDFYENSKGSTSDTFKERVQPVSGKGSTGESKGSTAGTKEDIYNKNPLKKIATQRVANINPLIEKFKKLNPSYERLFADTTQRASLERVVKKFGQEKVSRLLDALPSIVSKKFAPRISTPYQLEKKMGELLMFIKQEGNNKVRKVGYIIPK